MKDRYVLKCTAIKDSNTYEFKIGDVFYFNREASQMRCLHYQQNPYKALVTYYNSYIPFTSNIDSAKIWQKPSYAKELIPIIEKVGHFKCKIIRVKLIEIDDD